jgi:hypothetical protein
MTEDGREWEKKGKAETGERMSEIGKWRNFEKNSRAVSHGSPESHRKPFRLPLRGSVGVPPAGRGLWAEGQSHIFT